MISRMRQGAWILFALILFNLAGSAFFQLYWTKDNNWALDPNATTLAWLSDADYRAIEASTASEYKLPGGSTLIVPSGQVGRARMLASYQLTTPDGRWHGRASTRSGPPATQTWLGVAVPIGTLSVLGLFLTVPRPSKGSKAKAEHEEFAAL